MELGLILCLVPHDATAESRIARVKLKQNNIVIFTQGQINCLGVAQVVSSQYLYT